MNLKFMTHWPDKMGDLGGKETYFIPKIWQSLMKNGLVHDPLRHLYIQDNPDILSDIVYPFRAPKHHTIRKGDRWKPGDKIHFQLWSGKPYKSKVFQFAPIVKVKSVQKIQIKHNDNGAQVFIDNEFFGDPELLGNSLGYQNLQVLSRNDGFDSLEHFFTWFHDDFEGQIIHWTDLRY